MYRFYATLSKQIMTQFLFYFPEKKKKKLVVKEKAYDFS